MGTQRFGYTAVLHWKIDNRHFLAMPCEMGRKAGARDAFRSIGRNTYDLDLPGASK